MFARTARTRKLKIPWRNEEIKCNASGARFKRNESWKREEKNVWREGEKGRRELKREGRKEKNSRTWRESGTTAEAFRHSRNFQRICRRARSSVSSPVTSLLLPPSPFRAVFRLKLRKHEEGRRDGFRCADTPRLFPPPQFIDTSRGCKKEYWEIVANSRDVPWNRGKRQLEYMRRRGLK